MMRRDKGKGGEEEDGEGKRGRGGREEEGEAGQQSTGIYMQVERNVPKR